MAVPAQSKTTRAARINTFGFNIAFSVAHAHARGEWRELQGGVVEPD
jgi:hypothetical protein